MRQDKLICGLDIGTGKICATVGKVDKRGEVEILTVETSKSRGVQKGVVVDLNNLTDTISEAVEKAEEKVKSKINRVYINIGGEHIEGKNARGIIKVSDRGSEIRHRDIDRAINAAKTMHTPLDREVLHAIPQGFVLDGQDGIKDPTGLYGSKLQVDLHIITGLSTLVQNIIKCVHRAGLEVEGTALSALAASSGVLTGQEKALGVILIDIGDGTTDIVAFSKGAIVFSDILPFGGGCITGAISANLRVSLNCAEELKIRYGTLDMQGVKEDEVIMVKDNAVSVPTSRRRLCDIIIPETDKMLSLIKARLEEGLELREINAGIVITGGASLMEGLIEKAETFFGLPVKMGIGFGLTQRGGGIKGPLYATSIGLVRYGIENGIKNRYPELLGKNLFGKVITRSKELYHEYF